ncbi:hypothetical protein [Marinibactrum halimedae]|uniref:Uncharacterized protein n=1 Tax=Marinibactrum halimedae TaxID=1444977 RepID=A0AA37WJM0_9GAMM|nr:hypothetical protein [Marinibactrum halimedae]MCD9460276.1 hypothetical protein [Marinibactrum halimedae]GLS24363.1 hypothetical protein GCM10007877_00740 [Marinibactrum halimedae]
MSSTNEITASIEDYLLSLADSLQDAQQQLSQRQVASLPGQPAMAYQLPKLDFQLKIALNMEQQDANIVGDTLFLPIGDSPSVLPPVTNKKLVSQSGTLHEYNVSTISGSFVAVPVKEVQQAYVIQLNHAVAGNMRYELTFLINRQNNLEPVERLGVEVNVEKERLKNFNEGLFEQLQSLQDKTELELASEISRWFSFSDTTLISDSSGEVSFGVSLIIPPDLSKEVLSSGDIQLPLVVSVRGNNQRFILPFSDGPLGSKGDPKSNPKSKK